MLLVLISLKFSWFFTLLGLNMLYFSPKLYNWPSDQYQFKFGVFIALHLFLPSVLLLLSSLFESWGRGDFVAILIKKKQKSVLKSSMDCLHNDYITVKLKAEKAMQRWFDWNTSPERVTKKILEIITAAFKICLVTQQLPRLLQRKSIFLCISKLLQRQNCLNNIYVDFWIN